MIKTYQVRGLLEWKALIPAGKAHVRVVFKGGQMATMGMLPAEFATANVALQHIIESSDYFRTHRITTYPPEPEGKEYVRKKVRKKVAEPAVEKPAVEKPAVENPAAENPDSVEPEVVEPLKTENDESECGEPDPEDYGQNGRDPNEYNQC